MSEEKQEKIQDPLENKYVAVIAASKRARQLLARAEKHNLTVDTEKVILQSLNEFLGGKVGVMAPEPGAKKKAKE